MCVCVCERVCLCAFSVTYARFIMLMLQVANIYGDSDCSPRRRHAKACWIDVWCFQLCLINSSSFARTVAEFYSHIPLRLDLSGPLTLRKFGFFLFVFILNKHSHSLVKREMFKMINLKIYLYWPPKKIIY